MVLPRADVFPNKGKWVDGARHNKKGVYYALILAVRNRRKISNCLSRTKQRECPMVCYIHAQTLLYSYSSVWELGVLYTYQRGASALLVSTNRAIPTASNREASDNAEFHAFFVKNVLRK